MTTSPEDDAVLMCDVDFHPDDLTADDALDELVLTAGAGTDEAAKAARLAEYRELFPDA